MIQSSLLHPGVLHSLGWGGLPGLSPGKAGVSIRQWGREDWEGEQKQLMACGQSLLSGRDLLTFTLHLLGRAYQKLEKV